MTNNKNWGHSKDTHLCWSLSVRIKIQSCLFYREWECLVSSSLSLNLAIVSFNAVAYFMAVTFKEAIWIIPHSYNLKHGISFEVIIFDEIFSLHPWICPFQCSTYIYNNIYYFYKSRSKCHMAHYLWTQPLSQKRNGS